MKINLNDFTTPSAKSVLVALVAQYGYDLSKYPVEGLKEFYKAMIQVDDDLNTALNIWKKVS